MSHEIIDQIKIGGLQNFDRYDKLNPADISIKDSAVNTFSSRYRRNKYRFVIDNLLFSSALTNSTSCNGLNKAKESLINGELCKTPGILNIAEIKY